MLSSGQIFQLKCAIFSGLLTNSCPLKMYWLATWSTRSLNTEYPRLNTDHPELDQVSNPGYVVYTIYVQTKMDKSIGPKYVRNRALCSKGNFQQCMCETVFEALLMHALFALNTQLSLTRTNCKFDLNS